MVRGAAGFVAQYALNWAAQRSKSASDFYTAGGGITGFQNGLAVAGDYMSAATLLGITSLQQASHGHSAACNLQARSGRW